MKIFIFFFPMCLSIYCGCSFCTMQVHRLGKIQVLLGISRYMCLILLCWKANLQLLFRFRKTPNIHIIDLIILIRKKRKYSSYVVLIHFTNVKVTLFRKKKKNILGKMLSSVNDLDMNLKDRKR